MKMEKKICYTTTQGSHQRSIPSPLCMSCDSGSNENSSRLSLCKKGMYFFEIGRQIAIHKKKPISSAVHDSGFDRKSFATIVRIVDNLCGVRMLLLK